MPQVKDADASPAAERAAPERPAAAGYHWRGLLVQSFEFNMLEDAFRLGTDNTLRALLVTKPFWHDYFASLRQFNMRRWNDGDSFLVNYIGHPMQGGVTAYLEIQNSPSQSRTQWGEPGYWRSRGKAFLWSTVFSTYEELGPTGEAGIGNEGGYTYDDRCILHCGPADPPSGRSTNNTGWVDFIVTPTAGMVWVFAEDFLDREVSERLIASLGRNSMTAKIVRGSLNPTRTMANFLRGRKPWYRDWDYPEIDDLRQGYGLHFLKAWDAGGAFLEGDPTDEPPRWAALEIAPHYALFATPRTTTQCTYCVAATHGGGLELSLELWKFLYADVELSHQPGASPLPSDRAGGSLTTAFFGVKVERRSPRYAASFAARPGLLHWSRAFQGSLPPGAPGQLSGPDHLTSRDQPAPADSATPAEGGINHFAWNFLLAGDYRLNSHLSLRAGISESLVRYRNACLDSSGIGITGGMQWLNYQTPCRISAGVGKEPWLSFLSHEDYVNRASWGLQLGPVISF